MSKNYVKEYKGYNVPEGATHVSVDGENIFIRNSRGIEWWWDAGLDEGRWVGNLNSEFTTDAMGLPEEPTQEWVDGLPPVGCECEYETTFFTLDKFTKGECYIIAFYKDRVWVDIKGCEEFVINLKKIKFRPLKTEKEKEREAFIEKAASIMFDVNGEINDLSLGALFDDGFKAPEGE